MDRAAEAIADAATRERWIPLFFLLLGLYHATDISAEHEYHRWSAVVLAVGFVSIGIGYFRQRTRMLRSFERQAALSGPG